MQLTQYRFLTSIKHVYLRMQVLGLHFCVLQDGNLVTKHVEV